MEGLWPLMTVLGPILLIAVIVWVVLRNRRSSRGELERSERGARELREELEAEDAGER